MQRASINFTNQYMDIERVYFHKMVLDSNGYAYAGIVNPRLNMGVYVKYRVSELNRFIEWKMMGE